MKTVPLWKVAPTGVGSKLDETYVAVYTDQPMPQGVPVTYMHQLFDFPKGCEIDLAYVCFRKADLAAHNVKVVSTQDVEDRE